MSKSVGLKFIAMILTAICLVGALVSGLGAVYIGEKGLYSQTPEERNRNQLEYLAESVAEDVARDDALETYAPGNYQWTATLNSLYYDHYYTDELLASSSAMYTLSHGTVQETTYDASKAENFLRYEFETAPTYPVAVIAGSDADNELKKMLGMISSGSIADETGVTNPSVTWPGEENVDATTAPSDLDADSFCYSDYQYVGSVRYHIFFFQAPVYQVTVWIAPDARDIYFAYSESELIALLYPLRFHFLTGLIGCTLMFLVGIVYLCWAAGRKRGTDEVQAVGLNRLPLDLYAAMAVFVGFWLVYLCWWLMEYTVYNGASIDYGSLAAAAVVAFLTALLAQVYIYAVAAQVKIKGGFWWKNTLIGRFLRWVWKYVKLAFRGLFRLIRLIPLIWQWLLVAGLLVFFMVVSIMEVRYGSALPFVLCLLLTAGVIAYAAYAFGVLAEGTKRMSKGDLTKKVSTKFLVGFFRDSAENLNALADVAVVAAQKQLKSERMKTELITNVSHDIKTPLTSIINFVDLLQKPHTETQEQEYLAVLERQSQRLKKLIEDLMEMSKASTGNIQVNITAVDACEAVNQALGEFADKLEAQRLIPVVRLPEGMVPMQADGRLVWRVLSNVLSNVVKYALPGTRVYVDVVQLDGKVLLSVKNISREELNVSAEELMERFVRGDASRNTEGSGLGLNIAKSLMDVQHGLMQLLVDGDLFKVTLIFPGA